MSLSPWGLPSRLCGCRAGCGCGCRLFRSRRRKLPIVYASRILCSKRRASLRSCLTLLWLLYCIATTAGAETDEVDDVSSLPEPYGPDRAMADGSRFGPEISQPRAARRLRQIVRTARLRARAD